MDGVEDVAGVVFLISKDDDALLPVLVVFDGPAMEVDRRYELRKRGKDMPSAYSAGPHDYLLRAQSDDNGVNHWLECKCGWSRPLTSEERSGDWRAIAREHTGQEEKKL